MLIQLFKSSPIFFSHLLQFFYFLIYRHINSHEVDFYYLTIFSYLRVIYLYTTLFAPSSITALIIPIMVTLCHNLVRLPPICLLQRGKKTDQKFLPGKVTMHSPAPRCDSLKVRPMALSERKRGLLAAEDWTPKGYIYCRTKTKKK